jgi:hypothetical protein
MAEASALRVHCSEHLGQTTDLIVYATWLFSEQVAPCADDDPRFPGPFTAARSSQRSALRSNFRTNRKRLEGALTQTRINAGCVGSDAETQIVLASHRANTTEWRVWDELLNGNFAKAQICANIANVQMWEVVHLLPTAERVPTTVVVGANFSVERACHVCGATADAPKKQRPTLCECKSVWYCTRACQKQDRASHKAICKLLLKSD